MEITKAYRKMVSSLAGAKGRREHGLFVAEGTKCVLETANTFALSALLATEDWIKENGEKIPEGKNAYIVKRSDLIEMSSLSTPPDVIAVYHIPAEVTLITCGRPTISGT